MEQIPHAQSSESSHDTVIEQELTAAYAAHAGGLLRHAMAFLDGAEDARDALQETFLRYFVERRCGGQIDNPRAWLYRVLRNYLLDWSGKAARKNEIAGSDADAFPGAERDPETLMHQAQVATKIRQALTDRELNCLLLRAAGLSYVEVADVLDLRAGTVGAYLARAQKKVKGAARDDTQFYPEAAEVLLRLCYEAGTY